MAGWISSWRRFRALDGTIAVLRLLPRVSKPMTAALAVTVAVNSALPIGFTLATGFLIGSIPPTMRGGINSSAGSHTLTLLLIAAALIFALRILAPFEAALAQVFGRAIDRHLQERVMLAVGHPPGIEHLEDPEVLDLIRTSQGVGTAGFFRPSLAVTSLAALLPSWIQALGSALILAAFHWWLALIWVVMWPVLLYYLQREYISVGEAASGQSGALRRADYYRDLALTPTAAKEVRVWGLPDWLMGRFQDAWESAMGPVWVARRPDRTVPWLCTSTVVAINLLAFGLLAWSGAHGMISLAALAIFIRATIDAGSFRAFDDVNQNLAYAAVSVPSMLSLEQRLLRATVIRPTPQKRLSGEGDLHLQTSGLRFRYPGQTTDQLMDINLDLLPGRSVAIVGANGAGKTTLVKLLCKLYQPTGGKITVDGIDLVTIDASQWRRHVAAIFQDFTRYHLSARDNVTLGALHLAHDSERMRDAARRAGALEIGEALPCGWDTVLSRQYTDGVDLSGGQWQRLALARALFAVEGGARLLILDEPTASLDVRAEAELYDRFLDLTAGLTTVLISHRFSTVRRADQIVVLEQARIVERGTHDELIALGGTYARMFGLQAERFAQAVEE